MSEDNRSFLLSKLNIKDIYRLSLRLEIQNLPIDQVIEGLVLLSEEFTFENFNDNESIINALTNKIDEVNDSLGCGRPKRIDKNNKNEFPHVDKRTEEEKIRSRMLGERNKSMTIEERDQLMSRRLEASERRKILKERDRIKALEYVSHDSEDKQYSILVLCADDTSFLKQKYVELLTKVNRTGKFLKHPLSEYKVYYIGESLAEVLPFRLSGDIADNIPKLGSFDIILSEHCSFNAFTGLAQNLIKEHLNSDGYFITPNYTHFNFDETCYNIETSDRSYIVYKKNEVVN